jgi:hypothetical protein
MKKEFCIMENCSPYFRNERFAGSERHEIFEGRTGNRKKSIEDGLVIFTTPEIHRTSKNSIHLNPKEWLWLKRKGQLRWCEYYGKTTEDFIKKYGRNYL